MISHGDLLNNIGDNKIQVFIESLRKYFLGVVEVENDIIYKIKKSIFEKEMLPAVLNTINELMNSGVSDKELNQSLSILMEFFEDHYKDHEKLKTIPMSPYHIKRYEIISHKDAQLVFPTSHLYYVKTDYGIISNNFEIGDYHFFFDGSKAKRKENNVKTYITFRLVHAVQEDKKFFITLEVDQEKHDTFCLSCIVKELNEKYNIEIPPDLLKKAISKYKKKIKNLDYFIMKNAEKDLMEEFEAFLFLKEKELRQNKSSINSPSGVNGGQQNKN